MNFWCFLFGHKKVFAFRPGESQKLVRVQCVRCGEVCEQFWADVDDNGNLREEL